MKAIFKKTAFDRIMSIVYEAQSKRKEIDYILVTPQEFYELRATSSYHFEYTLDPYSSEAVTYETVDLKQSGSYESWKTRRYPVERYRVAGQRIVVAPIEYHPL